MLRATKIRCWVHSKTTYRRRRRDRRRRRRRLHTVAKQFVRIHSNAHSDETNDRRRVWCAFAQLSLRRLFCLDSPFDR